MAASHTSIEPQSSPKSPQASLLRARLPSILAIAPLGVWTIAHLWNNLSAFGGAEAWERSVTTYPHPIAQSLTLVLVLAPLLLHTVWGIGRLRMTKPNNVRYGFYANLKFLLQRLSAVGVLFFLGAHIWVAMLQPRLVEGHAETFVDISQHMRSHMPTLAVYVLGTLGVCYHLANGLSTFAFSLGLIRTPQAQKRTEWVFLLTFFVLLGMAWSVIYALWRAGG
jgi:succinate dehydrogenase / fumarate reductase cytochrome b subunit